jgi:sulfur transfer complex TusBCD TusB component (DsrH family)
MAHVNDTIVVMGDGLLLLTKKIVDLYPNLYCLSNEQSLLRDEIKSEVKIIEYSEFADLVLQFKRCVSLK